VAIPTTPERDDERSRHDQLEQGAAEHGHEFAPDGKHQMTGLVDGEIETIQPPVTPRGLKAAPAVDREHEREPKSPAPFIGSLRWIQDLDFVERFRLLLRFRGGTFAPFFRASDRPMAIACLRLFTLPPRPDFPRRRVPRLRRRIALSTLLFAPLPYFRRPDLREDVLFAAIGCSMERDMTSTEADVV
jgi:hypothetical protein